MTLELVSLALNPRGTLYPNKSLIQITLASGNEPAAEAFQKRLDASAWSLYRVRRIYHAGKVEGVTDRNKKGMADRAVERLCTFPTRLEADAALAGFAESVRAGIEEKRSLHYVYLERKGEEYPAREEFYSVAPACVETKARYGIEWFDGQWDSPQRELF